MNKTTDNRDLEALFTCNPHNDSHIGALTKLCTDGSYDKTLCIPDLEEQSPYRAGLGAWGLVVVFFGVFGNLMTLMAVPYAAKRKRFDIHTHWNKLHIFVMNLAVADLCYCAIPLPFYLTLYFSNEWIFGEIWCKIVAIVAHISGYGGWLALSVIAIVRMIGVWSPQGLRRICTERGSKIIIVIQWLFTALLLLPSFLEDSLVYGYNCVRGKCDLVKTGLPSNIGWIATEMPHVGTVGLAMTIICLSYLLIYVKIKITQKKLIKESTLNIAADDHNHKAGMTMLLICCLHVSCTLPHVIYSYAANTYSSSQDHVYNIFLGVVWFPIGCNFIIYVAQQDQYWNAYRFFFQEKFNVCRSNSIMQ